MSPIRIYPYGALLLAFVGLVAYLPHHGLSPAREALSRAPKVFFVAPNGDDSSGGARSEPLQTISAAAGQARAGDVVRISPGVYDETVEVGGEGTRDRPIVFEAEIPGSVIVSGERAGFAPLQWSGDDDVLLESANHWVTLRGLVFRGIGDRPAVRASTGWRIEDCVFERLSIGVNARGHDVTVTRSIFQDIDSPRAHAIVAYGGRNLRLSDLVIQRVNKQRLVEEIAHSAVSKFLFVDGLVIKRVVSRDNVGPGLWLDSNNTNFVIRQNYVEGNRGDQYHWEGAGIWIENNPSANGHVYGNVITRHSGAGIEIMESSDVWVRDNVLLGNESCIALRNLDRGEENEGLRDIRIERNLCGDWQSAGVATGIGEWANWDAASSRIAIDGGLYLISPDSPIFSWLGEQAMTLREANVKFGFEASGLAAGSPSDDHRTEPEAGDDEVARD